MEQHFVLSLIKTSVLVHPVHKQLIDWLLPDTDVEDSQAV